MNIKFAQNLWQVIVGSVSAIAVIVSSILWISTVNAKATTSIEQNRSQDERLQKLEIETNDQKVVLREIKTDIKYIVKYIDELRHVSDVAKK